MISSTRPHRWIITILTVFAAAGLLGVAASPATAHEPTATLVSVTGDASGITLDVRVPLDRYDFAYGTDLAEDPEAGVAAASSDLDARLQNTVEVSAGGIAWDLEVGVLETTEVNDVANLAVEITATPPPVAATGPVELRWTLITDTVYSHKVYVVRARDAEAVIASPTVEAADILGLITTQQPKLLIDGEVASARATFATLVGVGFDHFREGPDHLVFLALVALGVARRRQGWRTSAKRLALLTTTFTAGHSLSLAAATMGWVDLPGVLIETAIAVTIMAAAVHAVSPTLTPRAEFIVTGAFGLVHGCGFAGTLADLALSGPDAVVPLLGFNVGLEIAQLLALALVAVPILVLGRSTPATVTMASAAGIVALGWISERALGWADPFAGAVTLVAGTPERLALVLAAAAALVTLTRTTNPPDTDAAVAAAAQRARGADRDSVAP
ncbi:MAG: HupE/UreJ family protein [Actinobacteria bacterium]|nr:HupE/UreJ family protein [Actinomycetota bacterium]